MRRIKLIWVGHQDYLSQNSENIQKEIAASLSGAHNVDTSCSRVAVTPDTAVELVRSAMSEGCCGAVIVFLTWVECNVAMAALKELRELPCLFWGFPLETVAGKRESTGSYVSATMFAGVVQRLGLPCRTLYQSWNDSECIETIGHFANAALAVDKLNYAKIGLFGYTSMNIYTGTFDHVLMRYMIGPDVEQMDTYSLIRETETIPQDLIDAAKARLSAISKISSNVNEAVLDKTMAMYVALRNFCTQRNWDAVNVKCQYELSKEYKLVPCVALSLLAEDGITASCEGDMCNTVSMLLLQYLTGDTIWYGDSLTAHDNIVQFSPCGFMPFSMSKGTASVQKFMEHPGFSGIQVSGVLRPERVTFIRLVEDIGGYHLLVGAGTGIETEMRGGCMPALNVVLDGDLKKLEREYAGQHFAITYGDRLEDLRFVAELLDIDFVEI